MAKVPSRAQAGDIIDFGCKNIWAGMALPWSFTDFKHCVLLNLLYLILNFVVRWYCLLC